VYEYGILKSVEVILRRGRGKRKNNGGNKPNRGIIYVYMEISQQNPLYNYYVLIKNIKNEKNLN
jgi:hypothetical protein